MQRKKADVVVIGGGPGGYPAALRLAVGGKKVVLIEAGDVGGTCLNWGCIPTKTLLNGVTFLRGAKHAVDLGIRISGAEPDWPAMVAKKNAIVTKLRAGVEGLLKGAGVEVLRGFGVLASPREVVVDGVGVISTDHIIIATGSEAKELKGLPFDGDCVHSSKTIMDIKKIPSSIAIIGAGAIGAEFASMFSGLGSKVYLIEALPRILPLECETVASVVLQAFQRDGVEVFCGHTVVAMEKRQDGVRLQLTEGKTIEASLVLVGVGRSLNTDKIGIEKIGVSTERGAIVVDDRMSTNIAGVWAVGDITAKSMLAHVATHQGVVAALNILGKPASMRYDAVPSATFTTPEVASVGLSLEMAKSQKICAKRASFPLQALGRAIASSHTDGFVNIVFEEETGRIVGAQAVGYHASELISEITIAIANELTVECIADTIHAHPTYAESWAEASFIAEGIPMHFPKNMLHSVLRG